MVDNKNERWRDKLEPSSRLENDNITVIMKSL